ncbi:MAG: glycosyltransferase family 2 protein [Candidatus Komeilibacteria bacterium]
MENTSSIYIVIPAYNVADRRLRAVLEQLRTLPYQVVVVDDGSGDATAEIAREFTTVISHPLNRGQGAALLTGMRYALQQGAEIIVHFDADGQMDPNDIAAMIAPLQQNEELDLVLGSRFLQVNNIPWTKKYLLQKPALIFQHLTSGLRLTDVHNGFRAFRATAAARLDIRQDRMAHASEIIMQIKRHGWRYQEVPVTIRYYDYGQGLVGGLRIIGDLLKQRLIK